MPTPKRIEDRIQAALDENRTDELPALAREAAETVRSLRKQLNDEIREAQREAQRDARDSYSAGRLDALEESDCGRW